MKADYGTYSNAWLIVGPLSGAAVLGGLAFLPVPAWAQKQFRGSGGPLWAEGRKG